MPKTTVNRSATSSTAAGGREQHNTIAAHHIFPLVTCLCPTLPHSGWSILFPGGFERGEGGARTEDGGRRVVALSRCRVGSGTPRPLLAPSHPYKPTHTLTSGTNKSKDFHLVVCVLLNDENFAPHFGHFLWLLSFILVVMFRSRRYIARYTCAAI